MIALALQRFCVALRFLTILPVSWRAKDDGKHYLAATPYFPAVGLVIGIIVASLVAILNLFLPTTIVAAIAMAVLAFLTGFLHLDGLADSCDGLFSARSPERSLEIMKDSAMGVMGGVGLFFVLLIKFACLSSFTSSQLVIASFLMPIAGRCALLWAMATQKYAREKGSCGSLFYSDKKWLLLAIASFSFLFCAAFLVGFYALPMTIAQILLVLSFGSFCKKRIGGATGDTLGATSELSEMFCAFLLALVFTA